MVNNEEQSAVTHKLDWTFVLLRSYLPLRQGLISVNVWAVITETLW